MIVTFSGPSAAGKDTLAEEAAKLAGIHGDSWHKVVSCTTRDKRPGEVEGEAYKFISNEEFQKKIDKGDFLEYEEYSQSRFYGKLKDDIKEALVSDDIYYSICTPGGKRAVENYAKECGLEDRMFSIMITADLGSRVTRYVGRTGVHDFDFDDMNELFARVNRDFGMFLGFEKEVNLVIDNSDKHASLSVLANKIIDEAYKTLDYVSENERTEGQGRYQVKGFFGANFSGLSNSNTFDDFSRSVDELHSYASEGNYVSITDTETGEEKRYTPDEWMEAINNGGYPSDLNDIALDTEYDDI